MKIRIIILLTLFLVTLGFAQNYNDALLLSEPGLYSGARALGMGNSYTALSNDFSAVLFNPAGLGLIKRFGLSVNLNSNSFRNSASFFNNTIDAQRTTVNLNDFGFVFPVPTVRGSLVFALGYSRVKDFTSKTEFDGFNNGYTSMIQTITGHVNKEVPITYDIGLAFEIRDPITDQYIQDSTLILGLLNQSGKIRTEGSLGYWSFAVSTEVAKGLFVGGTFNILTGTYKRDRDYYEDDTRDVYNSAIETYPGDETTRDFRTFYLNDIIDLDLSGWNFKLGVLYDWKDFVKIGAAIKFPSYYTIKDKYYVNVSSEFGTGSFYELADPIVDEIEYKIKTPFEYSAGASVKSNIITLSGEVKLIDYTQMEFTEGLEADRIMINKKISDLFNTKFNFNLGGEVKIPKLPVWGRMGIMYFQSPYTDDSSEFDKKYLTAGIGILLGNTFKLDLGYAFGWWKNFSDNYDSEVSRIQQDINVHNVALSLSTSLD